MEDRLKGGCCCRGFLILVNFFSFLQCARNRWYIDTFFNYCPFFGRLFYFMCVYIVCTFTREDRIKLHLSNDMIDHI